ncbi:MAG: hypothetical protein HMLKMBBP_01809 [Planctomycetes bacterium]|nr:hypothetical protein [Planctomycetota bacterium]
MELHAFGWHSIVAFRRGSSPWQWWLATGTNDHGHTMVIGESGPSAVCSMRMPFPGQVVDLAALPDGDVTAIAHTAETGFEMRLVNNRDQSDVRTWSLGADKPLSVVALQSSRVLTSTRGGVVRMWIVR